MLAFLITAIMVAALLLVALIVAVSLWKSDMEVITRGLEKSQADVAIWKEAAQAQKKEVERLGKERDHLLTQRDNLRRSLVTMSDRTRKAISILEGRDE